MVVGKLHQFSQGFFNIAERRDTILESFNALVRKVQFIREFLTTLVQFLSLLIGEILRYGFAACVTGRAIQNQEQGQANRRSGLRQEQFPIHD